MLGSRRACILSCAIVFSGEISVEVEEVPELYSDPDPILVHVDLLCRRSSRALLIERVSGEEVGVYKSGKTRKGNIWLRGALVEAALGATRTKHSAVAARYLPQDAAPKRLPGARGRLLYDRRHTERVARRAIQTLEQQGYRVTLERVA